MANYKYSRRTRKLKKFGKKLGIVITFLIISYIISLASFYLYFYLSDILMPLNKNILGFAAMGLVAGMEAVLISLINKKFVLTVVISFIIDCIVDSILSFSTLGTQVIQFVPGLLAGMLLVLTSWQLLRRKLMPDKEMSGENEEAKWKYALARKLIKDPNKITLELFKEVCGALQGINPKIDKVLKEADRICRTIDFLGGGDPIGFVVCNIKVKTKKDEERKEKLLFFIDLVNDIRDEVNAALVKVKAAGVENNTGNNITAANFISSAIGPTSIVTISTAIIAASTIGVAQAAGVMSDAPFLQKNESQIQESTHQQVPNKDIVTQTPSPILTNTPIPDIPIIATDNGWGHFSRIFNGPPGSNMGSYIDQTVIPFYVSIHNTGTAPDRLIGAESAFCNNIAMQDMSPDAPNGGVLSGIDIPAENTVELRFMGQRLVCEGASGVNQGDRIPVGLIFEKYSQIPVLIEIRTTPE